MTFSGMHGVLNDAISAYFADAMLGSAPVARWCVGSRPLAGVFHVPEERAGAAGSRRGWAGLDATSEGRNFKNPAEKRGRLAGGKSRDTGAMKLLSLLGTVERLSRSNEDAASSGRLAGCDFIPKTSGNVGTGQRRRGLEEQMRKRAAIPGVIGAGLLLATAAFADPYNPGERAIIGGLLDAGRSCPILSGRL